MKEKITSKENLIKFAPSIVIVVAVLLQYNIFVTPMQLEVARREVMQEVAKTYVQKEQYNSQYNDLKDEISEMKKKIDKIYDFVTRK